MKKATKNKKQKNKLEYVYISYIDEKGKYRSISIPLILIGITVSKKIHGWKEF